MLSIIVIFIIIIIIIINIIIESLSQHYVFAGCSFSESRLHLEIRGRRGQSIQSSSEDTSCSQQCCLLYCLERCYTLVLPSTYSGFFYTVPSAPMTMGTVLTFFFHILPILITKSLYFSIFSSSFFTTLVSPGTATSMIFHSSIILSISIRSGLLASIVLSVCTIKSHNSLTCSFSITGSTR